MVVALFKVNNYFYYNYASFEYANYYFLSKKGFDTFVGLEFKNLFDY